MNNTMNRFFKTTGTLTGQMEHNFYEKLEFGTAT
jgi:hypothetical protein